MAMTQTTQPVGAQVGPLMFASSSGTIPAGSNTVILEVPTLGLKNIGMEFDVGVNALHQGPRGAHRGHRAEGLMGIFLAIDVGNTNTVLGVF